MPDMTRRSLQPVLPRSPKVQNTRLASWISLAKYWINVVAPPSMELIATPASTIPSADTCFSRDRPRITTATAMEPRKDHRGNANAAGQIQGNDGKGRAKGGTLRYAQGGSGCQGIVKNGLQNTPRQPKPSACDNGGADPRHPVVPNDQIDLFIRGSPENSLDQLRYRRVIGPGTEGKQDGHQKQQRQEQQKQNAPGLIFAIVRQLVFTHQW